MIHKTRLPMSPEELARQLVNLRYDALAEYLVAISAALLVDSMADKIRERWRLARSLSRAASRAEEAARHISEAWQICEPHMDGK